MMRNNSTALAPINRLPPEILAHVLVLSGSYCARKNQKSIKFHDLAAVCVYWRRVAMNATDLWAHVDIGPGTPSGLTDLMLARAKNSSLHVHVFVPRDFNFKPIPVEEADKLMTTLALCIHRVWRLDIESNEEGLSDFITRVLHLWLECGNVDVFRTLAIYHPRMSYPVGYGGINGGIAISKSNNAERMLHSFNRLHLESVDFGWNSSVYYGLVDLRLIFHESSGWDGDFSVTTAQLAATLSASPELAILKLKGLSVHRADNPQTRILMKHLSVLNLVGMES
ncbi:hypothetical protein FRC09_019085, partial [Ceratobasidium sp. 395]